MNFHPDPELRGFTTFTTCRSSSSSSSDPAYVSDAEREEEVEASEGDIMLLLEAELQMVQSCTTCRLCWPVMWSTQRLQRLLRFTAA